MAKKDITLVLSSGAALGLAHIGSIEVIEKHFNIKAIVGTSMGSIVGGLYACGFTSSDMVKLVKDLSTIDYIGLVRIGLPGGSLLETKWLEKFLIDKTEGKLIEDLPIPYAAIAFDIRNRRSVIINKGPVGAAMTASSIVPFVFEPFHTGDHSLFDGAIEYPLPLSFAKIFSKNRPIVAVSCLPDIKPEAQQIEITRLDKDKACEEGYLRTSVKLSSYAQAVQALSQVVYHKPFLYINNYAQYWKEWEMDEVENFYQFGKDAAEKAIADIETNLFDIIKTRFDSFLQARFK